MKRHVFIALLLSAAVVWAGTPLNTTPFMYVRSTDIHTTMEMVNADTGFTQITADTTIRVEWAVKSHWDSLNLGNGGGGGGEVRAVYSMASTADSSGGGLFFQDDGQGSSAFVAGVFGNATSPTSDYLIAEGAALNLGTNAWTVTAWARGLSPGNPGIGTLQTVWALIQTPDHIEMHFNASGYPSLVVTDDKHATVDSITVETDYYDSTFHQIVAKREGLNFTLQVDNGTKASTAVSNAASALDPDTLLVFGTRTQVAATRLIGARQFRGQVDHMKVVEDSTTIDSAMVSYGYARSLTADSILVHISGVGTDSTHVDTSMLVALNAVSTTARTWHAYETAHLDSDMAHAIIVYTNAVSPHGTGYLDSIAAGDFRSDKAHLFGGTRSLRLRSVEFIHESPTDTTTWQLRYYPSVEDSRDLSVGYDILATARLHQNESTYLKTFGRPGEGIYLSKGGILTVYAQAASGSIRRVTGSAILEVERP